MGKRITVRTCVLDPLGFPDLSDLIDEVIDLAHIEEVTQVVAIDDINPQRPAYYPYANIVLRKGRQLIVPLDRETRLAVAEHSIEILRAALSGGIEKKKALRQRHSR